MFSFQTVAWRWIRGSVVERRIRSAAPSICAVRRPLPTNQRAKDSACS
jgi:hypothetical protein